MPPKGKKVKAVKEKVKRVKGQKDTKKARAEEKANEEGKMIVDENGEVKYNTRSKDCAIVSVGKQGDEGKAWPDYVS